MIVGSDLYYVMSLHWVPCLCFSPLWGNSIGMQVRRTVHGPWGSCGARMNDIKSLSSQALPTQGICSFFREVPFPPSSLPNSREEATLTARNYVRNRSHTAPFLPAATWMTLSLSGTRPQAALLASSKRTAIQLLEKAAEFVMRHKGQRCRWPESQRPPCMNQRSWHVGTNYRTW